MADTTTMLAARETRETGETREARGAEGVRRLLLARGLSECDQDAALRLSKLAGAVVSLAVAAPFGGPALDDPPAVVRAALEVAWRECAAF